MRYLIILALITTSLRAADEFPSTAQALFGGADAISLVRNAERVTACVLAYTPPREENGRYVESEKYSEGAYVAVPATMAKKLKDALTRDSTYGWDYAKPCYPRWHVKLRFQRGKDTISIRLCFDCYILDIEENGKHVGLEDFEGAVFIDSMKALFPNDEALNPKAQQNKDTAMDGSASVVFPKIPKQ